MMPVAVGIAISLALVLAASVPTVLTQFTKDTVPQDGKAIDVVLYIESKCPDSSRFVRDHLMPFYRRYPTVIHNLKIVPFGLAECTRDPSTREINCTCQHRLPECEMNQLMNCIMYRYHRTVDHLQLLACIQGRPDFDDSVRNCLKPLNTTDQIELVSCAKGQMGAQLLYTAGKRTKRAGVNWVPWIEINGKRYKEAEHIFQKEICSRSELC